MCHVFGRQCLRWVVLPQPVQQRTFSAEWHHHVSDAHAIEIPRTTIKEGQNVRMIEVGNSLYLALEEMYCILSRVGIKVGGGFGLNNLDSYLAIDACIFCKVYIAHASASNETLEAI